MAEWRTNRIEIFGVRLISLGELDNKIYNLVKEKKCLGNNSRPARLFHNLETYKLVVNNSTCLLKENFDELRLIVAIVARVKGGWFGINMFLTLQRSSGTLGTRGFFLACVGELHFVGRGPTRVRPKAKDARRSRNRA